MDNLLWINGRQLPFENNAIFNTIEHTEIGLTAAETDWWMQCFAARYWSEWSVVLRIHCFHLLQAIANHREKILESLSEIQNRDSFKHLSTLFRMIASLERVVEESAGPELSVWTINASEIIAANSVFVMLVSEGNEKLLISLPHLDDFLLRKKHEEKVAQKSVNSAMAAFNQWKKAIKKDFK